MHRLARPLGAEAEPEAEQPTPAEHVEFEEGAVWCAACSMQLNGPTQWEDHRISKQHRKNVAPASGSSSRSGRRPPVHMREPPELKHVHDACKDLCRLDQALFRSGSWTTPLILTRLFMASCVPPARATKVLRRARWRSELWASIVALASGSRSSRRIALLVAVWAGTLPPQALHADHMGNPRVNQPAGAKLC